MYLVHFARPTYRIFTYPPAMPLSSSQKKSLALETARVTLHTCRYLGVFTPPGTEVQPTPKGRKQTGPHGIQGMTQRTDARCVLQFLIPLGFHTFWKTWRTQLLPRGLNSPEPLKQATAGANYPAITTCLKQPGLCGQCCLPRREADA